MKFRRQSLFALLAIAGALAVAACGDDDEDGSESEESAVTAEQAITEIDEVRSGLDDAVTAYADGDADEAQTLAEDAYLEHFELVEGPLEEVDPELNEGLEETIREEFVDEIESGAPPKEVESLRAEIDRGLDQAETALKAGS